MKLAKSTNHDDIHRSANSTSSGAGSIDRDYPRTVARRETAAHMTGVMVCRCDPHRCRRPDITVPQPSSGDWMPPLRKRSQSTTCGHDRSVCRQCLGAQSGSTTLLRIHACLPTGRPRRKPYCSKSSTVALNKKRPCATRPSVTSGIASTRPPPA